MPTAWNARPALPLPNPHVLQLGLPLSLSLSISEYTRTDLQTRPRISVKAALIHPLHKLTHEPPHTSKSECQCPPGLQCGQEEAYNSTSASNTTTLLPSLHQTLGGDLTLAFYLQPFSFAAVPGKLSDGAPTTSLPLSACDLEEISSFVLKASGVDTNSLARNLSVLPSACPAANTSASGNESNMSHSVNTTTCPACPEAIVELGTADGNDIVRVVLDEQRRVVYQLWPSCSCAQCKVEWTGAASLPEFAWTHVTIVQLASGEVEMYHNGSLSAASPSSASRRPRARTVDRPRSSVGSSVAQPDAHKTLDGKLLDLVIWNASLVAEEIAQLTAPPRALPRPGVVALHKYSTLCSQEQAWRCIDVDECRVATASAEPVCGQHGVCTNSWGSYTCTCLAGFVQDAINGTCARCPPGSTSRFGGAMCL